MDKISLTFVNRDKKGYRVYVDEATQHHYTITRVCSAICKTGENRGKMCGTHVWNDVCCGKHRSQRDNMNIV